MKVIAVIPARYGSSRLPGKPLAEIGGRPMIQHVWQRVSQLFPRTIIATDHTAIADVARGFGAEVVLTDPDIATGTMRSIQAYREAGCDADILLNVQGDELFISPYTLTAVVERLNGADHPAVATAATPFPHTEPYSRLADPNRVKVVTDSANRAIYFSRSVIPALRSIPTADWPRRHTYLIHHGVYAFATDALEAIKHAVDSPLARAEQLEQLAWLQAGMSIGIAVVPDAPFAIDTPADLARARAL